ncbi:hypothetical protein ES707_11582 [subsurface metagenome]
MASTSRSLSNSLTTVLIWARSLVTPVEVSLWVTSTALTSDSLLRDFRISSTSAALPHSEFRGITSAPNFWAMAAKRSPKTPIDTASTLSPGDKVLTTAASRPPVPDPVSRKTSFLVWNSCFSLSVTPFRIWANSEPRWFIICRLISLRTTSGQGVGPGMRRLSIFSLLQFSS